MLSRRLARPIALPALVATLALTTACSDEQVLYSVPAPFEIPTAPTEPTDPVSPHGEFHGGQFVATAELIPEPERRRFATRELGESTRDLSVVGLTLPVPVRYRSTESASQMRIAQYNVPHRTSETTIPGEFIVFYFGPGEGGGVMDNARRWAEQFQPGSTGESPVVRFVQDTVNNLVVSRLTLEGAYVPAGMGPAGPAAASPPQEDWAMDTLIVEGGPQGSIFIRLTGPADLVRAESEIIEGMAARVRPGGTTTTAPSDSSTTVGESIAPSTDEVLPAGYVPVAAPGVAFPVPQSWVQRTPSSSLRAAEFAIPGADGADYGEAVLFHFGSQGSGPTIDNINRWISMVSQPDGTPSRERAVVSESRHGQLTATKVRVEGTYTPSSAGPMMPEGDPKRNHALVGLVVDGGREGPIYIRITGPRQTIRAQEEALKVLLEGLAAL
ncbi:MAG: hypothetical protein JJU11_15275 [Candidatus Sumerlaeia bacterium]|nr:hypothetical protein [Candidatus Sumerlaeia bacterium]